LVLSRWPHRSAPSVGRALGSLAVPWAMLSPSVSALHSQSVHPFPSGCSRLDIQSSHAQKVLSTCLANTVNGSDAQTLTVLSVYRIIPIRACFPRRLVVSFNTDPREGFALRVHVHRCHKHQHHVAYALGIRVDIDIGIAVTDPCLCACAHYVHRPNVCMQSGQRRHVLGCLYVALACPCSCLRACACAYARSVPRDQTAGRLL
jgi:hypothetical protein